MRQFFYLFYKPSAFLLESKQYTKPLYLALVSFAYGIYHTIERIDRHLLKESFNRPWPGWELLEPVVNADWLSFWLVVSAIGAPAGLIAYFLGGWWYKIRLQFCGATQVDKYLARHIHIYSQFVLSFPNLVMILLQSFFYANYRQAWQSDVWWLTLYSVFPFWSCFTSYYLANRMCKLKRKAAMVWLVFIPAVLYLLSYWGYWQLFQTYFASIEA